MEQDDEWLISRRYFSLESIAALCPEPPPTQALQKGEIAAD